MKFAIEKTAPEQWNRLGFGDPCRHGPRTRLPERERRDACPHSAPRSGETTERQSRAALENGLSPFAGRYMRLSRETR